MNTHRYISTLKYCYCSALFVLLAASLKPGFAEENLSRKERLTGFLVVAADRGFVGNEKIIDEFELFAKGRNASLIFVTDERTQKYLGAGVDRLLNNGAERIVVMPLFISGADPRYVLVRRLLERSKVAASVSYVRPYGESVIAVEDLADKFRQITQPADTSLIVVGYGAVDNSSEQKMLTDWRRIVEKAADGFGFSSINVLMGRDKKDEEGERLADGLKQRMTDAVGGGVKTVVVPFHLGPRFDGMMSFNAKLKRLLPKGVQFIPDGNMGSRAADNKANTDEYATSVSLGLAIWMQREANRSQPLAAEDVGVVFLSHGSDFNWNETMREAVQPLMKRYKVEFAFSMADQSTIERAIRKLEQRGAKAAIIVRVFAMEDSFRKPIERMAGLDIEGAAQNEAGIGASHHDHGHGTSSVPAPRIRTSLPIQTVGGLGSSPLFAAALLDRALALSKNPARDTVILVAHGSGSDHQNRQWKSTLEEIAEHMRTGKGNQFHTIKVATWREDWPDKRVPWIEKVRHMFTDAKKEGGGAIVIPARTTGQGPEREFLDGLEYELGSGFAPHPLFVRWVDENVKTGLARFAETRAASINEHAYSSSSEAELWW
ncbi:MAG: cobalamin biosynthesis protein CbiX [Nitrosospira sp.]|nr:cobalamin biosynthesis protein CbiX [Nitrosospira sp.]